MDDVAAITTTVARGEIDQRDESIFPGSHAGGDSAHVLAEGGEADECGDAVSKLRSQSPRPKQIKSDK